MLRPPGKKPDLCPTDRVSSPQAVGISQLMFQSAILCSDGTGSSSGAKGPRSSAILAYGQPPNSGEVKALIQEIAREDPAGMIATSRELLKLSLWDYRKYQAAVGTENSFRSPASRVFPVVA